MSSGERPIGAAKGKQSDTEACANPPPPPPCPVGPASYKGGWGLAHNNGGVKVLGNFFFTFVVCSSPPSSSGSRGGRVQNLHPTIVQWLC